MRLRWVLLSITAIGLGIVASFLYTRRLSRQLLSQQQRLLRFYAQALQYLASAPEECIPPFFWKYFLPDPNTGSPLLLTPMVAVDDKGRLLFHNLTETLSVPPNQTLTLEKALNYLDTDTLSFPPIEITYHPQAPPIRIYYGEPLSLRRLRLVPLFGTLVLISLGLVWILVIYMAARYRQERLWVGLTREAAHQLGTPLSGLLGSIELLEAEPNTLPTILPNLKKDIQRIEEVVDRFSKIGAPPKLKPGDLSLLLREVQSYFSARLPDSITIEVETPSTPLIIPYNRTMLRWVLENLIRNSLDALPPEGGKITLRAVARPDGAVIQVIDSGRGIPPKAWEAIFRPGYTTKPRGWGIGLALARRIIEVYHHGAIFVRNSSPRGTTIEIYLPRQKPSLWRLRLFWRREVVQRWRRLIHPP